MESAWTQGQWLYLTQVLGISSVVRPTELDDARPEGFGSATVAAEAWRTSGDPHSWLAVFLPKAASTGELGLLTKLLEAIQCPKAFILERASGRAAEAEWEAVARADFRGSHILVMGRELALSADSAGPGGLTQWRGWTVFQTWSLSELAGPGVEVQNRKRQVWQGIKEFTKTLAAP